MKLHRRVATRRVRVALGMSAAAFALAVPTTASASTSAFQIGQVTIPSNEIELPNVVIDSSGTAYAVWPDFTNQQIDYCVLPAGATACAESGALSPVNEPGSGLTAKPDLQSGVSVTLNDGIISIVTQVYGPYNMTLGTNALETEEWQAADGTATFNLVNSGNSVAWPDPEDTDNGSKTQSELQDGVVVPGTDELGSFNFEAGGPPTFEAYPLKNPPTCSENTSPACAFATLEPSSDPTQVGNFGNGVTRQIASSTGANAGILGVRETYATSGSFACNATVNGQPFHISDAFVYGSGVQSATNNYNVSPGQPDSAWKVAATQIPNDCPAHELAVGGGPGGFGMLESAEYGSVSSMSYLPFDTATDSFDEPAVPVDPNADANLENLVQDANGNLYATAMIYSPNTSTGSADQPVGLYYSGNGGQTWEGPAPLESTLQPEFSRQATAVDSAGQGMMIISTSAGDLYALPFNAAEAATQFAASLQNPPAVSGSTVTVGLSCAQVPCTVTTNLTSAGTSANRTGHTAPTTLGSATVTISQPGVQNVQIPLNGSGTSALQSSGGKLAATLAESTAVGAYAQQTSTPVTLTEAQTTTTTTPPTTTVKTPALSRLKLSTHLLRTGLKITYRDTLAGRSTFVIDAIRRHGRLVTVGSFTHRDKVGTNTVTFNGKVGKRRLPAGRYELKLTSTLSGHTSRTLVVTFTVVRPKKR